MPYLRMKDESPLTEYHGAFDCLPGKKSPDLSIDVAVKLAKRLPEIFEPVDFDIEAYEQSQHGDQEDNNLVTIRLTFNPIFPEGYHSASGIDFDKVGDEKEIPFNEAKKLLERFPTAFEVVTGQGFQGEDSEVEVESETAVKEDKTTENKATNIPESESELDPTLDQQILELVKETPHSFDELEKKLNIPFNQLRGSVISLSKTKQIIKDDDDKWAIMK